MSRKGLLTSFLGLCAAGAVATGCGEPSTVVGTNAEIEEPAAEQQLDMTEYKFKPPNPTVATNGLIKIRATNAGREYHALRVVVPGAGGADAENPAQVAETTIGGIDPGRTEELNLKLKPGTYTWYCPLSNHRELGMKGKLKVQ